MSSFRRSAGDGAKLLLRMFGGRTKRGRQINLLQHAEHVMRSGLVEEPAWLDAMRKAPPAARFPDPKPAKITFPEDKLIAAYYRRHPMARFTPLDLTGPTFVQRYAWRQLELMEKEGLTENEARLRVDADVAAAAAALAQRAQHAAAAARGEAVPATPAGQEMSEEMLALAAAMPPTQKRAMAVVQDAEERVLHQHRQQQRRQGGGGSGPAS